MQAALQVIRRPAYLSEHMFPTGEALDVLFQRALAALVRLGDLVVRFATLETYGLAADAAPTAAAEACTAHPHTRVRRPSTVQHQRRAGTPASHPRTGALPRHRAPRPRSRSRR